MLSGVTMKNPLQRAVVWLGLGMLLVASCSRPSVKPQPGTAAIALSFDDRASIASWGEARAFLKEQGMIATFFVDRFDALAPEQVEILRQLAADGHEIGSHGFRHVHAGHWMEQGGSVEDYVKAEILPSIEHMARLGFSCHSFAYPHGAFTEETDRALAGIFDCIRKVDSPSPYGNPADGPFIGAFYIDRARFQREKLENIIGRAVDTGTVVSLAGHKIGPQGGHYWCSYETLKAISSIAREHGLPFVTLSELIGQGMRK